MQKLKIGYFITGLITGLLLLFNFLTSLPDGKLHIVYCDVGQGDAIYLKFPDGRDMLLDGGPDDRVLACLGKHMPFWDRKIDMVLLTHPEKDHMQGLLSVFSRYDVSYFLHSDIRNSSEGYQDLRKIIAERQIKEKIVSKGESVGIGRVHLSVIWPSSDQVARMNPGTGGGAVLGASTGSLNDGSVVFWLRYGSFDALFTGDADIRVEERYNGMVLANGEVEVIKVPHHGSKTGISNAYLDRLDPKLAVISVGKNSYGHPAPDILTALTTSGTHVLRTDQEGDIEVVSDGREWGIIE